MPASVSTITTVIDGIQTVYTTTCPESTVSAESNSNERTIVTTIEETETLLRTTCTESETHASGSQASTMDARNIDRVTVNSSSTVTVISETCSGQCPSNTATLMSSSSSGKLSTISQGSQMVHLTNVNSIHSESKFSESFSTSGTMDSSVIESSVVTATVMNNAGVSPIEKLSTANSQEVIMSPQTKPASAIETDASSTQNSVNSMSVSTVRRTSTVGTLATRTTSLGTSTPAISSYAENAAVKKNIITSNLSVPFILMLLATFF